MKFLIVNGYANDPKGQKQFKYFRTTIIQVLENQNQLIDIENEFHMRDMDDIEDYLFEQENSHARMDCGKQFDQIDVVFISGSANNRPWCLRMRKILTLIKMCLKTKKLLFAGSFGAQAIAYLCASNLIIDTQIRNNNGEGCKLSDFTRYMKLTTQAHDNFFMESSTGDVYTYSYETDEWVPKYNAGIHNRRDANEYQSIGKYIIKSPTFKPPMHSTSTSFLDANETICRVKKNYYHHWAFNDMDFQFVVHLQVEIETYIYQNQWDIHTFSFINPDRKFRVLAECNQRGPMVIECHNILACMFDFNQKYKGTIQIVTNFVQNALKLIKQQSNYNTISIVNERYFHGQNGLLQNIKIAHVSIRKQPLKGNPAEILRTQKKNFILDQRKNMKTLQTEDAILHVGFSVKKSRLPDYVTQNLMNTKKYRMANQSRDNMLDNVSFQEGEMSKRLGIKLSFQADRRLSVLQHSKSTKLTTSMATLPSTIRDDNQPIFDQQTVRQLLHPHLDRTCYGAKKLWVYILENHKNAGSRIDQLITSQDFISNVGQATLVSRVEDPPQDTTILAKHALVKPLKLESWH